MWKHIRRMGWVPCLKITYMPVWEVTLSPFPLLFVSNDVCFFDLSDLAQQLSYT